MKETQEIDDNDKLNLNTKNLHSDNSYGKETQNKEILSSKEPLISDNKKNIEEEEILINESSSLQESEISADYLSISNDKIYNSVIKVSPKEKMISITNKANNLTFLKIIMIDYISFVDESSLSEETKKELKNEFNLDSNILENKEICRLTYVPNKSKSKCNCCRCFFCCECKCSKNYFERNFSVSFFLVNRTEIETLQSNLSKLNNALFPQLNELSAKNRKRKILFFVNPKSGTGISLKLWEQAKSFFDLTDIEQKVILTERIKHAYDIVSSLPVGEYDGIVNCSGDGLMHEIINAIFHRQDKEEFLNSITIGALPAGSANGFSKAISDYCGDDNRIETHCYYIAKGISKKVDLQEMELRDVEKKVYSFLSIYYGFVADADLESEGLRCIGMFRTTLWGVQLWLCLRPNYGALYYLPENSEVDINSIPSLNEPLNEKDFIKENDNWNYFIGGNTKFVSEDLSPVAKANLSDGFHDIIALKESTSGRYLLLKELLFYLDDGQQIIEKDGSIKEGIHYYKTKCWRFIPKTRLEDPDDINVKHEFTRHYSIDGERYPICPIQVKTLSKAIKVYSGKE